MNNDVLCESIHQALVASVIEQLSLFNEEVQKERNSIIKSGAYSANLQKAREQQVILDWLYSGKAKDVVTSVVGAVNVP